MAAAIDACELPPRLWRKTVAAVQGVVLTVAAAHVLSAAVDRMVLTLALAVLAESFGRDVWWLWRHRHRHAGPAAHGGATARTAPTGAVATPIPSTPSVNPGRRHRTRVRTRAGTGPRWPRARPRIGPALTIVAVVVVWGALSPPISRATFH